MLRPSVDGRAVVRYAAPLMVVLGSGVGGTLLGVALLVVRATMAPFTELRVAVILMLMALAGVGLAFPKAGFLLPERPYQVPARLLLARSRPVAAFRWGAQLGGGFLTFAVTPALYAVPAIALAQRAAVVIVAMCMTYGLVRGLAIFMHAARQGPRVGTANEPPVHVGVLDKPLLFPLAASMTLSMSLAISAWQ